LEDKNINWVQGSITDIISLKNGVPDNTDILFHLAGNTSQWKKMFPTQYDVNVNGTINMVQTAIDKGVKKFVQLSSIAAFGVSDSIINEKTPSNAVNSSHYYAFTKWKGEQEVKRAVREDGLDAVILNPAHVIGPHDYHNWIRLIESVYNDSLPLVPPGIGKFSHVKDIVQSLIVASKKGRAGHNYLLGGQKASFLELINIMLKVMGKEKSYSYPHHPIIFKVLEKYYQFASLFSNKEPRLTTDTITMLTKKIVSDDSKAIEELGFNPASIEEQIKDTYDWIKSKKILD